MNNNNWKTPIAPWGRPTPGRPIGQLGVGHPKGILLWPHSSPLITIHLASPWSWNLPLEVKQLGEEIWNGTKDSNRKIKGKQVLLLTIVEIQNTAPFVKYLNFDWRPLQNSLSKKDEIGPIFFVFLSSFVSLSSFQSSLFVLDICLKESWQIKWTIIV
jgi:hypothetical protein